MLRKMAAIAAKLSGISALRTAYEARHVQQNRVAQPFRTAAGVRINPDSAMTIATVWACIRYLSQTTAILPWRVMRETAQGAQAQFRHRLNYLINKRPNPEWSSFQFRETLTHWALRWGNGYAEIEPDQNDRPFALWPIHPERVEVCRAVEDGFSSSGDPIMAGALYYEVSNGGTGTVTIASKRMFHIRGFGEGPVGVNVIQYAAQSLGWALATQIFGAAFFGNNATPATVVLNKVPLTPEGLEKQKAEFSASFKGPAHAHKTAHLDAEADIKIIGVDAEKAQLVEIHQHMVEEICRWFGVPPHKVMHLLRATFSNIEHQAIEVVVDSISPWVKRFEDEADYKLFGQNAGGYYTKMNMRALLRGDTKTRGEYYKMMRETGAYSANRILELEDENTIGPDGDKHVMQTQYTTLERIGEVADGQGTADPLEEDAAAVMAREVFEEIMARAHV